MGKPARYQLKVRHYEVDQYGHVNHAQYVHYLEVARIEALDALGLSLGEMRRHSVWVQEIREVESQRVLVTAEVTGAFATEDGRPARAPAAFREKLAPLCIPDAAAASSE
jgi:acyl-CoA thioesterase FadM